MRCVSRCALPCLHLYCIAACTQPCLRPVPRVSRRGAAAGYPGPQVTQEVIKPITAPAACRLTDLSDRAAGLLREGDVGAPSYFISHAWSMPFLQVRRRGRALWAAMWVGHSVLEQYFGTLFQPPPTLFTHCTLTVSMANHWDVLREGSLTAALGGKQNAHDWIMGWTDLSLCLTRGSLAMPGPCRSCRWAVWCVPCQGDAEGVPAGLSSAFPRLLACSAASSGPIPCHVSVAINTDVLLPLSYSTAAAGRRVRAPAGAWAGQEGHGRAQRCTAVRSRCLSSLAVTRGRCRPLSRRGRSTPRACG